MQLRQYSLPLALSLSPLFPSVLTGLRDVEKGYGRVGTGLRRRHLRTVGISGRGPVRLHQRLRVAGSSTSRIFCEDDLNMLRMLRYNKLHFV